MTLSITLIGGPTALIEIDGFRLLTDPTFDPPGVYQLPHVKLEKLAGPALTPDKIGNVDAVLLSHDQHALRQGRRLAHRHRDAGAPRPGWHRAIIGRRHRLCGGLEKNSQPPDLHQRRHHLV